MSEFNTSFCAVKCKKILDVKKIAEIKIYQKREALRESLVKKLMEPRRYFLFWKRSRSREEADEIWEERSKDWEWGQSEFWKSRTYKHATLDRFDDLAAMCSMTKDDFIYLSIDDAAMVERWSEDYAVECTNENCGWSGLQTETTIVDGEDSCPKCGCIVEPSDLER